MTMMFETSQRSTVGSGERRGAGMEAIGPFAGVAQEKRDPCVTRVVSVVIDESR